MFRRPAFCLCGFFACTNTGGMQVADREGWVEMGRADVDSTFTCHPDSVEFWEGLGWGRVGEGENPREAAEPTAVQQPGQVPPPAPGVAPQKTAGGNV